MAIPGNPIVNITPGVNKVSLSWGAISGSLGYKIYRSEDGSNYTQIATITTTSYEDRRPASTQLDSYRSYPGFIGLERNKQYWYKVTAYNAEGESSGSVTNTTTLIDTPYTGGTIRGKVIVNLICTSTDHMTASNPTQAQIQTLHDWIRANFTTKITLYVSRQILFATSGEPLNILNYLKTLVTSYGYDIVTLPHYAWFPVNPSWSEGITSEIQRIQECHDKCFEVFGKYPVASVAWQYNNDLIEKAVSLGYKLAPGGTREQGNSVDNNGSLGIPFQFYKPSKRHSNVPGNGNPANTQNIIAGLTPLQWGPYRMNPEPDIVGKSDVTGLGIVDSTNNYFAQQNTIRMLMEDSQSITFNDYYFLPCYIDPYWMFKEVNARSGIILPNGDTEMWHLDKQLMLWMKDRYGYLLDFYSVSELGTYLETVVTNSNPMPVYAHFDYNDQEGQSDQKGLRYESQYYHSILRHKTGLDGYIKLIQYAGYDVIIDEPAGLSNDWSIPGMYRRTNTNPVKDITFTAGGTTYRLAGAQTGQGQLNIHEPTKQVAGETLVMAWDVYDSTDTTRLMTIKYTFTPTHYKITFENVHATVSNLSVTHNHPSPATTKTTNLPKAAPTISGFPATIQYSGTPVTINYTTQDSFEVALESTLRIYDNNKVLVRTITSQQPVGASSMTWDGRNDAGAVVSSGTYSTILTVSDSLGNQSSTVAIFTITLIPSTANISPDRTQTFTAIAKDINGNHVTVPFAWTVSNPSIASINDNLDGTATVTGLFDGAVTVTASYGGITGTANLSIVSPQVVGNHVVMGGFACGSTPYTSRPLTGSDRIREVIETQYEIIHLYSIKEQINTEYTVVNEYSVKVPINTTYEVINEHSIKIPINTTYDILGTTSVAPDSKAITFTGTLAPGDELVIDMKAMTAKLNGTNVLHLINGAFFALLPGANTIKYQDGETARTITIEVQKRTKYL